MRSNLKNTLFVVELSAADYKTIAAADDGALALVERVLRAALEELKKFELLEERDQIRERNERDAAEQDEMDEIAGRRQA